MSSSIYLDPSFSSALTQYAGGSVTLETLVWQRFVVAYDIDVSKPLTDDELAQFKTFLELYESLGLSTSALNGNATPPSSSLYSYSDCYRDILNSPSLSWAYTDQGIQDIWNGFLQTYNIDAGQVSSVDFSALFSTYIKTLERQAAAYTPSLSTAEVTPNQDLQIVLWNRFLTIYGYSPTQQSTPALEKQFSQFLQQYQLWGIGLAALNSTNTLPSGDGSDFFTNALSSFYGQCGTQELTDLWNQFLETQGLTSNPTDLTSLQQPFMKFMTSLMVNKASFEATTATSPASQEQQQLFSSLMSSLANMLAVTEQVVITNAAAMKIYGAWQEQLTQQMTRTPNLVAVPDAQMTSSVNTTVRIPAGDPVTTDSTGQSTFWDLDQFTLGYNQTTMKEVIQWAYNQIRNGSSTSVSFSAGGTYTFALVTNSDGSKSIQVSITGPAGDSGSASVEYINSAGQYMQTDGSGTSATPDTFDNWVSVIGHTFCNAMSSLTESINEYRGLDSSGNPITDSSGNTVYVTGLTGHFTGDSTYYTDPTTKQQVLDTTEMQNRQEQNAVLQQYIAQIRAKRAVVQNASLIVQSTLQTAQTSINKIASLWTSILQAISTILHTLFERSSTTTS